MVRHAAPVALNLLTNVIATQLLSHADGKTITTYNHPIDNSLDSHSDKEEAKHMFPVALWAVFVAFGEFLSIYLGKSLYREDMSFVISLKVVISMQRTDQVCIRNG